MSKACVANSYVTAYKRLANERLTSVKKNLTLINRNIKKNVKYFSMFAIPDFLKIFFVNIYLFIYLIDTNPGQWWRRTNYRQMQHIHSSRLLFMYACPFVPVKP